MKNYTKNLENFHHTIMIKTPSSALKNIFLNYIIQLQAENIFAYSDKNGAKTPEEIFHFLSIASLVNNFFFSSLEIKLFSISIPLQ